MERDEFKLWLADYLAAFPNTHSWLDRLELRQATLAKWERALSGTDYQLAVSATDRIVMGKAEPVAATDYERTPYVIRAIAGRIADEQAKAAETRPAASPRRTDGFPAGRLFASIVKRCEAGAPVEDAVQAASREFAVKVDPDAGRRVACRQCGDTGLVEVWHPLAYQERGTRAEYPVRICLASCTCPVGQRRRDVRVKPEPEFDEAWLLRYDHRQSEEWNRERLEEFAPQQGRVEAFDEWNQEQ